MRPHPPLTLFLAVDQPEIYIIPLSYTPCNSAGCGNGAFRLLSSGNSPVPGLALGGSSSTILYGPQMLEYFHKLADVPRLEPGYLVEHDATPVKHEDGPLAAFAVCISHPV